MSFDPLTNLDVALSTRTKPADQQHVIVDTAAVTTVVTTGQEQDIFEQMLNELRVIRMALVKIACDDYRTNPRDFSAQHAAQLSTQEN